tara:strand:+ start:423 stop:587 length:165 start_codon:yes stop_codon:yes gene_type:complete
MQISHNKKCKRCNTSLSGEMLFYPEICLSCVIELDSAKWNGDVEARKELKKYEK